VYIIGRSDDRVFVISVVGRALYLALRGYGVIVGRREKEEVIMIEELLQSLQDRRGGGESFIKDLKRKANSLSRGTRQDSALGLGAGWGSPRKLLR
jgi:hypothetical protein